MSGKGLKPKSQVLYIKINGKAILGILQSFGLSQLKKDTAELEKMPKRTTKLSKNWNTFPKTFGGFSLGGNGT